ncbi:FtsX-like permease family protein [Catellatospora aurea]|uniref:FtsX-like permease family protein n=1 Tax=Catellatospora aurea TaxID=1337874 RepID=A0ABW2H296_9ACTN
MFTLIWSQLRRRAWRAGALFAAVLLATTGFTVLTGTISTSRLEVVSEVDANFRGAYDILVRPRGARTATEVERELVAPNQLAGTYGGITMDQYRTIQELHDVEVAAPIATLGTTMVVDWVPVDITDLVDRSKTRQLIRLDPVFLADRGLSRSTRVSHYVYLTQRPLIAMESAGTGVLRFRDGTVLKEDQDCHLYPLEVAEDGTKRRLCGAGVVHTAGSQITDDKAPGFTVFRLLPDGRFVQGSNTGGGGLRMQDFPAQERLLVGMPWLTTAGMAAIDPEPEARLLGLDQAVVSGRYLRPGDASSGRDGRLLPALTARQPQIDETLSVTASAVDETLARSLPGTAAGDLHHRLGSARVTGLGTVRLDAQPLRPDVVNGVPSIATGVLVHNAPPRYERSPDDTLRPAAWTPQPEQWTDNFRFGVGGWSGFIFDTAFRAATPAGAADARLLIDPVGVFDPQRLAEFSQLSRVPLETYQAPGAAGADARSRELLGDRPLAPSSNPQGYLAPSPQIILTLDALPSIVGPQRARDAISAVRVRVANVRTLDELTRERIRRIAEEIGLATGLDVDITVGSSLQPQAVDLAAGTLGRPELRLTEWWSRKGVAVAVMDAVDRKSVLLFGLILVVCVLFLANATTAAVRDRRRELAVLACVGWPRRRLAALVTGEVALVGLAAGLASAAVSFPLGWAAGVATTRPQALLAIPVALLLALLASIVPAIQAARAHPGTALAPLVSPVRRARRSLLGHTVFAASLRNTRRRPGRTLLAAAAVALGVGAFTALLTLTWVFHGSITGNLLGDAVSLRVRAVDTIAVASTLVLAVAALADVLYLNVRERAAELATLQAGGWSDGALARLVAYEGLLVGAAGAITGASAGLLFVDRLVGGVPPAALAATVAAALGGTALAGLAALLPASSVRRLRLAALLAQE